MDYKREQGTLLASTMDSISTPLSFAVPRRDRDLATRTRATAIPTKRNSVMISVAQKAEKCRNGY
jgi:hypothetical protein